MRSAINTCLMILFLLVVLFSSFSRAADCPIGDTPVLKFPLGTSQIYSTCTNGCRAEDNFSSSSTWTCNETLGYCTAAFFTTGESCTGSDDTDGSCDANGDCEIVDNGGDNGNGDNSDGFCQLGDANCVKRIAQQADKILVRQTQDREYLYTAIGTYAYQTESNIKKAIQDSNADNLFSTELIVKDGFAAQLEELNTLAASVTSISDLSKASSDKLNGLYGMSNYYFPQIVSQISSQATTVNNSVQATLGSLSRQLTSVYEGVSNTMASETSLTNRSIKENNLAITSLSNQLTALQNSVDGIEGGSGDNTEVMSAISSLSGDVSGLSADIGTLSGTVDGLSTALGDGFEGLNTELQGIGDGIDSIVGTLNGDGLSTRGSEGKIDFNGTGLYGEDTLTDMKAEIETLKTEYSEQMKAMRNLFSFDSSELNGGQYVEHRWKFHLQGHEYSFGSSVFPALLDNSSLIAAVLVFLAVLFGIRFLAK